MTNISTKHGLFYTIRLRIGALFLLRFKYNDKMMMKKSFLVLTVMLSLSAMLSAQNSGLIRGTVTDKNSGDKIPFATISLYQNGSFTEMGTTSNDNGSFKIENIAFGTYSIQVSFIGYETSMIDKITLSADMPKVNVGNLSISATDVALQEVQVAGMANTVSNKLDRKTYRASDFETAKGGNAVDILNKLPSVSVSPDGEVSVRGTNDFMVYLNGKPTQMEPSVLLAQLSSDEIQNIEVITIPSAKYDAQGKGGIINISTKNEALDGISVNAFGSYGDAPWGNFTEDHSGYHMTDQRYTAGANILYNKDKLSLNAGINYSYKNVNGARTGDARVLQSGLTGPNNEEVYRHMVAAGNRPEWYENFNTNVGATYKLSDMSELSASYYYGKRTEGRSAFYIYNNFYGVKDKDPEFTTNDGMPHDNKYVYNPNTDNRYGTFRSGSLDYSLDFGNKSSLTASVLYEHSGLSRELHNQNFGYDKATETVDFNDLQLHFRQTDDTPLDAWRFALNYEKELDNGNVLSVGVQPQFTQIEGPFNYDTIGMDGNWGAHADLENAIDLQRNIYAGYANYNGTAGKLTYNIGLRMEYTDQLLNIDQPVPVGIIENLDSIGDITEFTVKKLDWFPTLHLQYSLSEASQFNLAATRRINRPPVKNMAPFLYRRHLEVYVIGDPTLKPEYTNSAEIGYDQKLGKHSINITGFYRGTENAIFRVNTVFDETGDGNEDVLIRSYTNSGNTTALGAELNANLVAGSFAKFFIGGSLYHYNVKADIFGYQEDNSSLNWSLKGNANFMLTKELKFTADFDVKSATVTAQGKNDLFYMANTALDYTPEKWQNWNFSFRVLDILSSNIKGLDTRAFNESGQEIFYQETVYTRTGPIAEVGVSYAFNKKNNAKKVKGAEFGNDEF